MTEPNLCRHGYPMNWINQEDCGYDDAPDGATVTDLHELERFTMSGGGLVILTNKVDNEDCLVGRTVNIDGKPYDIRGYESCLIPGHGKRHCRCFKATGVLVREC